MSMGRYAHNGRHRAGAQAPRGPPGKAREQCREGIQHPGPPARAGRRHCGCQRLRRSLVPEFLLTVFDVQQIHVNHGVSFHHQSCKDTPVSGGQRLCRVRP
jgi:hypothetical protein